MQVSKNKIPTNLITGFLGAGKTSAIQSLCVRRPERERWAVLINEYGMVSLDHILVNDHNTDEGVEPSDDLVVDELAGGCFCCSLSMELPLTLARLIRRSHPHRLLIEPTGAGHPAAVIDMLRSGRLAELVELRSVICLVDPRDYLNPRITNSDVFRDQIQMADVVVINFTDQCSTQQIQACREFVEAQEPPKLVIAETQQGQLDPEWLDAEGIRVRLPLFPAAHDQHRPAEHAEVAAEPDWADAVVSLQAARPNQNPIRFENPGGGFSACGWIFDSGDVFEREELWALLRDLPSVVRLKGVFHCSDDWWSIQRRGSDVVIRRSSYRRDSRLEVISDRVSPLWNDLETRLMSCRFSETGSGPGGRM